MTVVTPVWLSRAYSVSLGIHAVFITLIAALAVAAATRGGANAAPDTLAFALALMVPVLLLALPATVALVSWRLCRRRGTRPGTGHMTLSIAAAAASLVLVVMAVFNV